MTRASTQTSAEVREERTVILRVDELNALAWELRRTDTKRSRQLGDEALRGAQAAHYERGQAYSRLVLGYSAMRASEFQTSLDALGAALEYFERSGDRQGSHQALNTLSIVYGESGNYVDALKTLLVLQPLCAELGEVEAAANALHNTGIAYFHLGDYTRALDYHFQALEAFRTSRHLKGEVHALIGVGMVYFEKDSFEEALDAFLQAQNGEVEDNYTHALLHNHLGRTYLRLGRYEQALFYNQESFSLMNALGDRLGASYAQDDLAAVYATLGQVEQAEHYLLESLTVKRETGDSKGEAETCLQLGQLYLHRGRLGFALDTLHEGLESAQRSDAKIEIHKAHRALAEAYKRKRQFREACRHWEIHEQLSKEVFDQASDLKLQALRVQYEVEQTERERELYRLKNVELARAVEALQTANSDKATLLARLEQQSHEDSLTGLYNRRYIDTQLEGAFAHAKRYGGVLSVAVCDIDHFKSVNDTFSHGTGDAVLRQIARLLQREVRQLGEVARYGGEEFVILFPDTSARDAAHTAERIREVVADYPWHTLHSALSVTVSVGVSDDLSGPSFEKLLAQADKKLYEAKRSGRNRVSL